MVRLRTRHTTIVLASWWTATERTIGPMFLGGNWASRPEHLVVDYRIRFTLIVIVAALALTLVIASGHQWTRTVLFLGFPAVGVAVGLVATGAEARLLPGRYTMVPTAVLLLGLISAHPPRRAIRAFQAGLAVWLLAIRPFDAVLAERPRIEWDPIADCFELEYDPCPVATNPKPAAPPFGIPAN